MSWIKNHLKCDHCGKFISYKDKEAKSYTPYDCSGLLEPPDTVDICGRCWNGLNEEEKSRLINDSWLKPWQIFK